MVHLYKEALLNLVGFIAYWNQKAQNIVVIYFKGLLSTHSLFQHHVLLISCRWPLSSLIKTASDVIHSCGPLVSRGHEGPLISLQRKGWTSPRFNSPDDCLNHIPRNTNIKYIPDMTWFTVLCWSNVDLCWWALRMEMLVQLLVCLWSSSLEKY